MVFVHGSTFISNLVVSNILGKETFGRYALILNTLVTATGISQLCTGVAVRKFVAEFSRSDIKRSFRILTLCIIVGLVAAILISAGIVLGARHISEGILNAPDLAGHLRASSTYILFSVLNGILTGFLSGVERYKTLSWVSGVVGVGQVVLIIVLSKSSGLRGSLEGLVIAAGAGSLLLGLCVLRTWREHGSPSPFQGIGGEKRIVLGFLLPGAFIALWSSPCAWLANVWLARGINGDIKLAHFTAANQFRLIAMFFPAIVNGIGVSMLNKHRGDSDSKSYSGTFWILMAVNCSYSIVMLLSVSLLSGPLLRLFGHDFEDARPVLLLLMLSTIPEVLSLTAYLVIQSRGEIWRSLLFVNIPLGASLVGGSYFLCPVYGALGLAGAQGVSWTIALISIVVMLGVGRGRWFQGVVTAAKSS